MNIIGKIVFEKNDHFLMVTILVPIRPIIKSHFN